MEITIKRMINEGLWISVIAAIITAVYFFGFLWEIAFFGTFLGIISCVPLTPRMTS